MCERKIDWRANTNFWSWSESKLYTNSIAFMHQMKKKRIRLDRISNHYFFYTWKKENFSAYSSCRQKRTRNHPRQIETGRRTIKHWETWFLFSFFLFRRSLWRHKRKKSFYFSGPRANNSVWNMEVWRNYLRGERERERERKRERDPNGEKIGIGASLNRE